MKGGAALSQGSKIKMSEQELAKVKVNGRIRCDYKQIDKFLKFKGFNPIRHGPSTHVIYKSDELGISIPVPKKPGVIPQGTIARMMTVSGISPKELYLYITNKKKYIKLYN